MVCRSFCELSGLRVNEDAYQKVPAFRGVLIEVFVCRCDGFAVGQRLGSHSGFRAMSASGFPRFMGEMLPCSSPWELGFGTKTKN